MSTRTIRQVIEGMTLAFDPAAYPSLAATIQFAVSGSEPGAFHLRIANGQATFHTGHSEASDLIISTPSEIWFRVASGEISGQDALLQGLYQASGDLSLLVKMPRLFRPKSQVSFVASDQRLPGPLPLKGMHWMGVAFLPWAIFWATFGVAGLGARLSIGLPLLLSVLVVAYRMRFCTATWMELGGLVFFAFIGMLTWLGEPWVVRIGIPTSSILIGALWLVTLVYGREPMTVAYTKWKYVRALWSNSTYLYINAVLTAVWGYVFVTLAFLQLTAAWFPSVSGWLAAMRYAFLLLAFVLTVVMQRRPDERRVENYEGAMARVRLVAWLGLASALGCVVASLLGRS